MEANVRSFLANLKDEDLHRRVEFSFRGGPKFSLGIGELMHHAAVHGIHHRGQVALLLKALGHVPGNFDILFYYCRENNNR